MHLFSCVLLYTQSTLQSFGGGGGSLSSTTTSIHSIHLDDATAATGQRHQCAHHTTGTGTDGEERVIEPIEWMTVSLRILSRKANSET